MQVIRPAFPGTPPFWLPLSGFRPFSLQPFQFLHPYPYELHDFFLYYMLRCGFEPGKIYRIACLSFAGQYEETVILKWLKTFYYLDTFPFPKPTHRKNWSRTLPYPHNLERAALSAADSDKSEIIWDMLSLAWFMLETLSCISDSVSVIRMMSWFISSKICLVFSTLSS